MWESGLTMEKSKKTKLLIIAAVWAAVVVIIVLLMLFYPQSVTHCLTVAGRQICSHCPLSDTNATALRC